MHTAQGDADPRALEFEPTLPVRFDAPRRRMQVARVEPDTDRSFRERARRVSNFRLRGRHHGERHPGARGHLLAQHTGQIAQPLEVLFGDRRHHHDIGLDNGAQRRDLARLVGAHFDHRDVRIVGQCEERERHAHEVVVVPDGGMHAQCTAQGRAQQLLRARFAVGANHANHGPPPRAAAVAGERAERRERVGHFVHRHPELRRAPGIIDDNRRSPARHRGGEKIMGVERLAFECDEATARRHRTRVGRDARYPGDPPWSEPKCVSNAVERPELRLVERAGLRGSGVRHQITPSEMISCTMSRSSNGYFTVPRIW